MNKRVRSPVITLVLLLVSMLVMSCQSSNTDSVLGIGQEGASNSPYEAGQRIGSGSTVIGFVMPADGQAALRSQEVRNGAAMALEDLADGKLTAAFYGPSALADPALQEQFKTMRLVVVDGIGNQAAPVEANVPVIALADNLEKRPPNSFGFGTSDVDSLTAGINAALAAGGTGIILAPDSEPDYRLLEIKTEVGGDLRIVRYGSAESADAIAAKALKGSGPFFVGILDNTMKVADLARALAGKGQVTIVGHAGWGPDLLGRPEVNGAIVARADSSNINLVSNRYLTKFGAPPTMAALYGYDATAIAAGIVRSAGEVALTRQTLLNSTGFRGATGSFRFSADGSIERLFELTVVEKGRLKIVGPAAESF